MNTVRSNGLLIADLKAACLRMANAGSSSSPIQPRVDAAEQALRDRFAKLETRIEELEKD